MDETKEKPSEEETKRDDDNTPDDETKPNDDIKQGDEPKLEAENRPKDEGSPDYKEWIQKSCWTYKFKHWWECNAVLLSCGIDPNKTPLVLVNDLLKYKGKPFSFDSRLAEAEERHHMMFEAICCGELKIHNVAPPDYSNPSTVYLIKPIEFWQWLKMRALSNPPEFEKEVKALIRQRKECADQEESDNDKKGTEHEMLTPDDKVENWVEIAEHFKRAERTVQRWFKKDPSMPIHQDPGGRRVYAIRKELDEWYLKSKYVKK